MANGYPRNFIERHRQPGPSRSSVTERPKIWRALPYIDGVSEAVSRLLRPLGIGIAHRPESTIRNLVMRPKTPLPRGETTNVIYRIQCSSCNMNYIGETGKRLHTRVAEHMRAVRRMDPLSLVAEHCANSGHTFAFQNAEILGRGNDRITRETIEAWHTGANSINRSVALPEAYQALRMQLSEQKSRVRLRQDRNPSTAESMGATRATVLQPESDEGAIVTTAASSTYLTGVRTNDRSNANGPDEGAIITATHAAVKMDKVEILPRKREFVTGEQVFCTSATGHTAHQILDAFIANTNLRLVSRKSGMFVVQTTMLYFVRITCSVEQRYLYRLVTQAKTAMRALFRSERPVYLNPENVSVIDQDTLLYCSFGGKASVTDALYLRVFLGPRSLTTTTKAASSYMYIEEATVIGGPEYVPITYRASNVEEGSIKVFILVECVIFLLLLILFTILAANEHKKRMKQHALQSANKSRGYKRSVLKDLDGQYVNVNMMDFTKNDHLRLVAMTTLFDACYDQFSRKERKHAVKASSSETATNYRVTMRKALSKLLDDGFNQSSSSSESENDSEMGAEANAP
nr:unnamed protein product [Spirometra erinaceieuropaei]